MRNFISFIKKINIYKKQELLVAFNSFSKKKKFVFVVVVIITFISMISLLAKINSKFTVSVPIDGGLITEGIIGMPTLVNPVLAVSDADKDLTSVIYSGLMRKIPDGSFIPDLADSYSVSADGKNYTFIIKENAKFHNGTPVTADDIVFTIEKIKNPQIKSPKKISWEGITVQKKDSKTVVFILDQPYISFMNNTTVGILPLSVWDKVSESEFSISPLNIKAIGSGPYRIKSVNKNKDGIPEKYTLARFKKFTLGKPHIKYLNIISFANEKDLIKALLSGSIDQTSGISPDNIKNIQNNKYKINTATLPRTFGLFFNNNKNKIFTDLNVLKALDYALDRQDIINQVLGGYGTVIHNPIPKTIIEDKFVINNNISIEEANKILDKSGWTMKEDGVRSKGGITFIEKNKKIGGKTIVEKVKIDGGPEIKLSFSITTGDTPELKKAVSVIKEQLEKIGVQVNIQKVYESGQLNQIIRERDYEVLFFGQIINHESDLFSFWHSSQKNDPGLNIAMYSNKKVDSILETIQKTLNTEDRLNKYKDLLNEFDNNIPALLIYSPKYLYITSKNLETISFETITIPSDRFALIYSWFAEKENVWKVFIKN